MEVTTVDSALGVILMYAFMLLPLLLLFWIYNDAEEKEVGGCLWVLLVIVFGYIALIIYLLLFHGLPAMRRPAGPRQNEDIQYRSMYRSEPSYSGPKYPNQWGEPSKMVSTALADGAFRDEELEKLISARKLTEARAYLRDMIKIAEEMGDRNGMANYKLYESRINKASSSLRSKTSLTIDS